MFQVSEVIDAVKNLASGDAEEDRSHCEALDLYAKQLGYQGFHHLRESISPFPAGGFDRYSIKLMRQICLRRTPSVDCAYFEFIAYDARQFGFYSYWIGWDKHGEEVRVPRPLDGAQTASNLRNSADFPVYVIESEKELLAWRHSWLSIALIPEQLARPSFPFAFNKDFLVEADPPVRKVRARVYRDYSNNIADG
jgi:hypothetical protein